MTNESTSDPTPRPTPTPAPAIPPTSKRTPTPSISQAPTETSTLGPIQVNLTYHERYKTFAATVFPARSKRPVLAKGWRKIIRVKGKDPISGKPIYLTIELK